MQHAAQKAFELSGLGCREALQKPIHHGHRHRTHARVSASALFSELEVDHTTIFRAAIAGRTPLGLFLPDDNPPSLLAAADRIRFRPITAEEYAALGGRA